MSRVVDRIRGAQRPGGDELCRGDAKLDYAAERRAHIAQQLAHLEGRSDRVRYALTMLYFAFTAFVGTSLTLAIDTLVGNRHLTSGLATMLSVGGVFLLLTASVNLALEAQAALASNRQEIRFYRDLQARRLAEDRCGS